VARLPNRDDSRFSQGYAMDTRRAAILIAVGMMAMFTSSFASAAVIVRDLDAVESTSMGRSGDRVPCPSVDQRLGAPTCRAALPGGSMGTSQSHPRGGSVNAVALVCTVAPASPTSLVCRVVEPFLKVSEGLLAGIFRPPRLRPMSAA
jgi:hypothetical protein